MNIYTFDIVHQNNAEWLCDQHVDQACYVYLQLCSNAFYFSPTEKPRHKSVPGPLQWEHPVSEWVRKDLVNYQWAREVMHCVFREYHTRYGVAHHAADAAAALLVLNPSNVQSHFTQMAGPPPIRLPEKFIVQKKGKWETATNAYKGYYIQQVSRFGTWNHGRKAPTWLVQGIAGLPDHELSPKFKQPFPKPAPAFQNIVRNVNKALTAK